MSGRREARCRGAWRGNAGVPMAHVSRARGGRASDASPHERGAHRAAGPARASGPASPGPRCQRTDGAAREARPFRQPSASSVVSTAASSGVCGSQPSAATSLALSRRTASRHR
ncbi:NAD dependent epimerase/dehydratase family domain protein [Burkholderia pseudomallei MSHR5608]|nr:NAD dependent epimerase/dehydratase family domain protein [Burkholderia pseudomallei MSHR5608]